MFMPINLIILAKHYVIRCNVIRLLFRLSVCDACELSLSGGFFQNLIIAPEISEMIRRDRTSYTVVSVYLRVPCRFVHCGVATTAMVGLLYGWTNKPCHTCTVMISGSPMTTSTVSLTRQEQLANWLISVRTSDWSAAAAWRFNPSMSTGNYSATSNNRKLVHWPLMGGLLHLVQRGGAWVGFCTSGILVSCGFNVL